jgi:hypothetical protein
MSASTPPKPPVRRPNEPATPESGPSGASKARPAGRIVHDERGNAVWNFGETVRAESTSRVLRRLDVPDLKVEGQEEPPRLPGRGQTTTGGRPTTQAGNVPRGQSRAPIVDAGGGYNPYNLTVPVKKQGPAKTPVAPKKPGGR